MLKYFYPILIGIIFIMSGCSVSSRLGKWMGSTKSEITNVWGHPDFIKMKPSENPKASEALIYTSSSTRSGKSVEIKGDWLITEYLPDRQSVSTVCLYFNQEDKLFSYSIDIAGDASNARDIIKKKPNLKSAVTLNSSKAYFKRGMAKRKNRDEKGAIDDFSKSIEINPKFKEAYFQRAILKRIINDYIGSIEDCTTLIELDPKSGRAYESRGLSKTCIRDYKGAIDDYSMAIKIRPSSSTAYSDRGLAKYASLDYTGAIEDYSKVIEMDPKSGASYYYRGLAKLKSGQKNSGCLDISKARGLGYYLELKLINELCY